jgi:hypothetical protein
MRTRTFAAMAVALLAPGAVATGAAAAKPKLWLGDGRTHVHAAQGEAARIGLEVEPCGASQTASILSNGKPVDQLGGAGGLTASCESGTKMAGTIKSVAVAPAGEDRVKMTATGIVHLGVEPWCTYTLPHKFSTEASVFAEAFGTATATLDKAASFAGCAPTREITFGLELEQVSEESPYAWETVG